MNRVTAEEIFNYKEQLMFEDEKRWKELQTMADEYRNAVVSHIVSQQSAITEEAIMRDAEKLGLNIEQLVDKYLVVYRDGEYIKLRDKE